MRTLQQVYHDATELEGRLRELATTAWDENDGEPPAEPERMAAADLIIDIADCAELVAIGARLAMRQP